MVQHSQPKLFGTDGIRGHAGKFPLDSKTLICLGQVLGGILSTITGSGTRPRILLGGDTRESSPGIAAQVASGLQETGTQVIYAGVITTPGIAHLTRHGNFQAGLMISASHNLYHDNGLKIFSSEGVKIPDPMEADIEKKITNRKTDSLKTSPPTLLPDTELIVNYVDHLTRSIPSGINMSNLSLVADCANGAASYLTPLLTKRLGLNCVFLNENPTGKNINQDCGSLHPERMAQEVLERRADLGVALDGDGDRAIFSTGKGQIMDGDGILWVAARFLKSQGLLPGNHVVGTVMTNYGLELALKQEGIQLARTPVGDKYVLKEMLRMGASLGGEPSGHVIFSNLSTTGDGLLSLLMILRIMVDSRQSLEDLLGQPKLFPQVIQNVKVNIQPPLESIASIQQALMRSKEKLRDQGRILVRYSGTEPLLRVMVEATEEKIAHEVSHELVKVIREQLG